MKQNGSNNILPSLLMEIGTEEIPARFLPPAIDALKSLASSAFNEYRISCGEIQTFATPRRITLRISSVALMQDDISKEVFGPSKNAAYDAQGNPTKAATGFAASLGIPVDKLTIKQKGKGDYVAAVIEEKGLETKAVLPELLRKLVTSLHFPKSMRWGEGKFSFVRPIHWILALFGSDPVAFEIDGLRSGTTTRGHRFLSPGAFQIREPSSYMNYLENNFVILDHAKRKNAMLKGINGLFENKDLQPVIDNELAETVTFLVEYPVPVLCSFNAEYLKLPKELLITVMKDHQKYFAVQNSAGDLANYFVVVSNTRPENALTVKTGAERVIKARFDDAKFYFHEDTKKRLADRVDDLKLVTFHDRIGNLYEKTGRIVSIAGFLADRLLPARKEQVLRAALLSKTDLISGVVREFPELQGIMGKYYAAHDGEDRDVSTALKEQYLPHSYGAALPQTDPGAIVSLADKLDNLVSFFSIGLIPTGSEDPFALRRQATGIATILFDRGYDIVLREIFEHAISQLPPERSSDGLLSSLTSFMEQRIEFILSSKGHTQDQIQAVLPLSFNHPLKKLTASLNALVAFSIEAIFPDFLLAIKRVNNITPQDVLPPVREDLLSVEQEKRLYEHFRSIEDSVRQNAAEGKYLEALTALTSITQSVNNFFDKVLVMDKQEEIKFNRLALLQRIWKTALLVADFSKLH